MIRIAGEICSLLLVGLALGFWVIAITTHGWLVVVHKIKRRKTVSCLISYNDDKHMNVD